VAVDARVDPRFASDPLVTDGSTVVFYASSPLRRADGVTLGSLSVVDRVPRLLDSEEAQCLCDLAALAENELTTMMDSAVQADLVAQIGAEKRRSLVDPLTRLWNREGIFEVLDGEIAPALAEKESAAIIMADLDHFKKINDEMGHPVGDEVLRQAARRMQQAVRDVDAVGRYGGEEFLIVLGAVDGVEHALSIAERIRARISADPITTEAGPVTITLSLGVAVSNTGGTVDALVHAADAAMYQAKRTGRNRSVLTDCGVAVKAAA
jgi:diguanylate cyclase (GGDEF)-like protein